MRRATLRIWLIPLSFALAAGICAQAWTPVVPGIDYQYFHLTSPRLNNVFVTRMDRATTSVIIDASLANGKILQPGIGWNTETIPNQAARYNGAFGYWGRQTARYRYKVVAAVNGNGFSDVNGCPDSAVAMNGALIKRTFGSTGTEQGGGMGFLYKLGSSAPTPGTPYMGGDLYLPSNQSKNRISFTDGTYLQFDKLNDQPISNGIIIYTHHYGARTPSASGVMEVVVKNQDSAPLRIIPWSNYVTGTAVSIDTNTNGGTVIPFDGYVIVASGSSIADLEGKIPAVGTEVRFSQETRDTSGLDWTNLYCGIGPMWGVIVRDGVKSNSTSASFTTDIAPRTCVAFNAQYIYFIVIDGRTSISGGMTLSEMADWVMSEFNVTDAVNDDGGGSSTMWVDGQVKNNPSDGSPRAVADGLMMIQLQPKEVSHAFGNGWTVYLDSPSVNRNLMTGPGNNFHVIQQLTDGAPLTIVPHSLNGLRAQDVNGEPGYWWYVKTASGQTGWVSQYYLLSLAYAKTWTLYQ